VRCISDRTAPLCTRKGTASQAVPSSGGDHHERTYRARPGAGLTGELIRHATESWA